MNSRTAFRGQPLLLLGGLVLGWCGLRVANWESPFPAGEPAELVRSALDAVGAGAPPVAPAAGPSSPADDGRTDGDWLRRPLPAPVPQAPTWRRLSGWDAPTRSQAARLTGVPWQMAAAMDVVPPAGGSGQGLAPATLFGSELLMVAGLAQMEVPEALLAYLQPAADHRAALAQVRPAAAPQLPSGVPQAAVGATIAPPPRTAGPGRWSGDAWMLLRDDTTTSLTSGRPSYGRSQAGAVLRYRLSSGTAGLSPQLYLRGSTALAGAREQEVAAGAALRPLPGVPLRIAAELRVNDNRAGHQLRPAMFAVTELPPVALPAGTIGEAYVQAGYVGGDFASAFVDGQARVDRPLLGRGTTQLRLGAAAWGGAQRGSNRLDVGPSASAGFAIGGLRARVAADYRLRVAGNAEPASGPAVTISAGF